MKSFEKREVLYFSERLFSRKCALQSFTRNTSGIVTDLAKFFLNFFHLESIIKIKVWFPSCTVKDIYQECHNFNFSYLHMEPACGSIFENISSLANVNSRTKFECTLKFLHIKLLGKGILSIKPKFLAN